tara:strand:- start:2206 stop:2313 length:108 start_codon:yes stop_codon:yes gene_type:complete
MEFIAQSPDVIFFGGVFGMFFLVTVVSMVAHKFFS